MFSRDKYWQRTLERERIAWLEERRELLDRIMLLAGTPWTVPDEFTPAPEPDPEIYENETTLREEALDY